MNTIEIIQKILESGIHPVIEFNPAIKELESYDPGMRAEIVGMIPEDSYYKIITDFTKFEDYNKSFAVPDWYDANGNPTLKWHESKLYPSSKQETIYDGDDGKCRYFRLVDDEEIKKLNKLNKLHEMYANNPVKSFQSFLIEMAYRSIE